eukprot:gene1774-543_t
MKNSIEENARSSLNSVKNKESKPKKRRQSILQAFSSVTNNLNFVSRRDEAFDETPPLRPVLRKGSNIQTPTLKNSPSDLRPASRSSSENDIKSTKLTRAKSQRFRSPQTPTNNHKMQDFIYIEEEEEVDIEEVQKKQEEEEEAKIRSKAKLLLKELKEKGQVEDESKKQVISEILLKRLSSNQDLRKSNFVKRKTGGEYKKDDLKLAFLEIQDGISKEQERIEQELERQKQEKSEQDEIVSIEKIKQQQEPTPLKSKAKSEENLSCKTESVISSSLNTFESPQLIGMTKSNVSDSLSSLGKDAFSPRSDDSKGSNHSESSGEKRKLTTQEKIFIACYTDDYSTLLSLFEENPHFDVNKLQNKTTLLHAAASNNCADIIELLIEKGADINILDYLDRTPLHVAASNGNYEASITLLGKGGSKVNLRDCYGFSPLFLAIKNHYFSIAEDLILFNGDVNFKKQDGSTILHDCLVTNNIKSLKFLLGLDLKNLIHNPKDSNGETPILKAVHADNFQIVKYYLSKCQNDIKLLAQNSIGQNVFHASAKKNSYKTLMHILSIDPSVTTLINQQDLTKRKSAPIHLAIQSSSDEVFKILLANNCDINIKDGRGNTPLHIAYQTQNYKFGNILIKMGANENVKNHDGMTPKKLKRISEK